MTENFVQRFISTRLKGLLVAAMVLLVLPTSVCAQDDGGDIPLGDVARSLHKKSASSDAVIDNDNLTKVMDDSESRHAAGSSLVFSLDPGGKNFHISQPEVSCCLSFNAKTSSLLSDPALVDELPRSELAKLDGPATIDGDSLQVSMHNGTSWELREVVIGLTIVRRTDAVEVASYGPRIFPAVAGGLSRPGQDSYQKQPDVTVLLHVKGSAAPATTATFRTPLNFALFPDQDWHWAIVRAKGIPPQAPAEAVVMLPEPGVGQVPASAPVVGAQSLSTVPPSKTDVAAH
jgi:hypothetical protein